MKNVVFCLLASFISTVGYSSVTSKEEKPVKVNVKIGFQRKNTDFTHVFIQFLSLDKKGNRINTGFISKNGKTHVNYSKVNKEMPTYYLGMISNGSIEKIVVVPEGTYDVIPFLKKAKKECGDPLKGHGEYTNNKYFMGCSRMFNDPNCSILTKLPIKGKTLNRVTLHCR